MEGLFLCHECGFSTKNSASLKTHKRYVHDLRVFHCNTMRHTNGEFVESAHSTQNRRKKSWIQCCEQIGFKNSPEEFSEPGMA